jgi:hypothetical protein
MTSITRIISGGQTGADQAGLFAAKELGLRTGGWAPKGFWTDDGHTPELLQSFGLVECHEFGYDKRTHLNVKTSDATLIFGNGNSPGSFLTRKLCIQENKTMYYVPWKTGDHVPAIYGFRALILTKPSIKTLNVAGNRERTNPGIFNACRDFLIAALGDDSNAK